MKLVGSGIPAELEWWVEPYNTDFHVILDVRNEASVAFWDLKSWMLILIIMLPIRHCIN